MYMKNQSFSLIEFGALVVILFSLFRVISKFRLRFMSCLSRSWEMQRELLQWLFQFWYSGILFQWLGSLDTASLWLGLFSTMKPRKGAGTIDTSCSAFKYRFYLFYDNNPYSIYLSNIDSIVEIEGSLCSRCYNFDSPVFLKKSGRDTQKVETPLWSKVIPYLGSGRKSWLILFFYFLVKNYDYLFSFLVNSSTIVQFSAHLVWDFHLHGDKLRTDNRLFFCFPGNYSFVFCI